MSTRNQRHREVCKYFLQGVCRYGDSCYFSHVRPNETAREPIETTNQPTICKYFQQGRCVFGNNCYNRHEMGQSVPESDEVAYENNAASTDSSPSSSSTGSNSDLVKRTTTQTKPKLRLATSLPPDSTNLSVQAKPFEPKNPKLEADCAGAPTPSSYYEALTGKPLNFAELDMDSSELNIFEPAYAEYLRKKSAAAAKAGTEDQTLALCPYSELQQPCPFGFACEFGHALLCDQCQQFVLDPNDLDQQSSHRTECMRAIEAEMEEAFATAASREKPCGICMEVVWEKEPASEKRFGILENCNHIFCLACIRKWRASKAYENKVVKACPECRVKSDYVTPSRFWFDNDEAKKKIIDDYKSKLGKTHCKYFKQGDGTCPFGNKCFYLHQYRDGRLATNLPEPTRRRRFNREGRLENFTNWVHIELNLSDDDDEEYDLFEMLRRSFLWDSDSDSEFSDFLELSEFYM